jgi:hemerythrin-like domain-containing protein
MLQPIAMPRIPESVRKQILFQHEVLRALLRRLASAAEEILRGEPAARELRDAQRTLYDVLEVHLRQEEETLAPILRGVLEPDQLARMHAEHAGALESLRRQRSRKPKQSAAASLRLVLELLARIAEEDRDLLGGDQGADISTH